MRKVKRSKFGNRHEFQASQALSVGRGWLFQTEWILVLCIRCKSSSGLQCDHVQLFPKRNCPASSVPVWGLFAVNNVGLYETLVWGGNKKVSVFHGTKITSVQNSHSKKEINVFKRRQGHQYISWESPRGLFQLVRLWFSEGWMWFLIPVAFSLQSLPLLPQAFLFVELWGSSCELVEAPDCATSAHNVQCGQVFLEFSD